MPHDDVIKHFNFEDGTSANDVGCGGEVGGGRGGVSARMVVNNDDGGGRSDDGGAKYFARVDAYAIQSPLPREAMAHNLVAAVNEDDVEGFNVRVEGGVRRDVFAPVGVDVAGSFAKGSGEGLLSKADDFVFTGKERFHLCSVLSVPRAARAGRIMLIDVMRFAGVGILSIHISWRAPYSVFSGINSASEIVGDALSSRDWRARRPERSRTGGTPAMRGGRSNMAPTHIPRFHPIFAAWVPNLMS